MEATPQPLEGLRGQVDNRVFFYYSRRREMENHGQEGELLIIQGRGMDHRRRVVRKARHTKAAEGGWSWIVISNSFLLVPP